MTIEYTWKISSLKTKTEGANEGAIVQTYWQKIGTDELGNEGIFNGATPFTSIAVPEGEFLPFAELTEANVLSWIQEKVVGDYETHVHTQIQRQIDEKTSPVVETAMPWAPETPLTTPVIPDPV